jgi:hypothetical protein
VISLGLAPLQGIRRIVIVAIYGIDGTLVCGLVLTRILVDF